MAKKSNLSNINLSETPVTARTETASSKEPGAMPVSIYLSAEDHRAVKDIAAKFNVNRHMVLSLAVKNLLRQYRDGELEIKTEIVGGKVTIKS